MIRLFYGRIIRRTIRHPISDLHVYYLSDSTSLKITLKSCFFSAIFCIFSNYWIGVSNLLKWIWFPLKLYNTTFSIQSIYAFKCHIFYSPNKSYLTIRWIASDIWCKNYSKYPLSTICRKLTIVRALARGEGRGQIF